MDLILQHILQEAEEEKQKILAAAQKEAAQIIAAARQEADALSRGILQRFEANCLNQKKRNIVNARLQQKTKLLEKKQEFIEAVTARLRQDLEAHKLKKEQVCLHQTNQVAEDPVFYLEQLRRDYETDLAAALFSA
jgi:vacuolar-type H+-ATPase subunit E/Vma4